MAWSGLLSCHPFLTTDRLGVASLAYEPGWTAGLRLRRRRLSLRSPAQLSGEAVRDERSCENFPY